MLPPIVIFAALFASRGSSVEEQGTHKPLVVSSNLTLGTLDHRKMVFLFQVLSYAGLGTSLGTYKLGGKFFI